MAQRLDIYRRGWISSFYTYSTGPNAYLAFAFCRAPGLDNLLSHKVVSSYRRVLGICREYWLPYSFLLSMPIRKTWSRVDRLRFLPRGSPGKLRQFRDFSFFLNHDRLPALQTLRFFGLLLDRPMFSFFRFPPPPQARKTISLSWSFSSRIELTEFVYDKIISLFTKDSMDTILFKGIWSQLGGEGGEV